MNKNNIYNNNNIIKEACCENFNQAFLAEKLGANRIELCSDLSQGGTTPNYGNVKKCKQKLKIPLFCIIRPRAGNFIYSEEEIEIMKDDIKLFITDCNIDGIVIGLLTKDNNNIDYENLKKLIEYSRNLNKNIKITFHMAIDEIINDNNYKEIINNLNNFNINRILTKGGKIFNINNIKKYIEFINENNLNIIILPGKGITNLNYENIIKQTNCKEIHGTKIVGNLNNNN